MSYIIYKTYIIHYFNQHNTCKTIIIISRHLRVVSMNECTIKFGHMNKSCASNLIKHGKKKKRFI